MKNVVVIGLVLLLLVSCAPAKEPEKAEEPETVEAVEEEAEETEKVWSDQIEDEWYFSVCGPDLSAGIVNEIPEDADRQVFDVLDGGKISLKREDGKLTGLYFMKTESGFNALYLDGLFPVLFNDGKMIANGADTAFDYKCDEDGLYLIAPDSYMNTKTLYFDDSVMIFEIEDSSQEVYLVLIRKNDVVQ